MLKQFLLKKMMRSQLKDVPLKQQEQLLSALEKNPELFQKIATETQALMKEGKDQMEAATSVMEKYQSELGEALKNE